MNCFEGQKDVQDKLKVDPNVARAFLNETLEHMKPYIDATGVKQDGLSPDAALEKVAKDSGLQIKTVAKIIQSNEKLFPVSKQAFSRQREASAAKIAAQRIAEDGAPRNGMITRGFNDLRRIVLTGHSPVFPFTHARNLLYGNPMFKDGRVEAGIFGQMVKDAWRFRGKEGDVPYAQAIAELKNGKNYGLQRSAGLVGPGAKFGDMVVSPESGTVISRGVGKIGNWIGESKIGRALRIDPANASKTFDALAIGRGKLFDYYWDKAPPELKTEAYAQLLARDMNYATGAVGEPRGAARMPIDRLVSAASDATGNLLLSSKLFYAKRMEGGNIFRYGPTRLADLLSKGGKMTPEQRAIANLGLQRWARITSTQLGILGANYAFAKAMGLRLPNLTDPNKADYGRMRIGNFVVPLSPLMEAVREPIRALSAAVSKRSVYEGAKEAVRPVVNALTPGIQLTGEQITGKEPFSGRQVPSIRNLVQKPKPTKAGAPPPITLGEYAATRAAPIAVGGAVHEFYQALRNENVPSSLAIPFIKAAAGGITSGFAGTHIYEDQSKEKPKWVY